MYRTEDQLDKYWKLEVSFGIGDPNELCSIWNFHEIRGNIGPTRVKSGQHFMCANSSTLSHVTSFPRS